MYARLVVDGHTIFNGDMGQWAQRNPDDFAATLDGKGNVKPWMQAALVILANYAITEQPVAIDVHTTPGGNTWTIEVARAA